jgi:hypothetical protein|tara:strand:+ start:501 stop:959 length:459 start_codon:yes stop_codon:yes gene_type:complete
VTSGLILIGGAVIVILTGYAFYLGMQLKRQKSRQEQADKELREDLERSDSDARKSVQIIAKALMQKDLTETEAAMRIGFLSQKIAASPEEKMLFSVFQQLAEATSHVPILVDWQALEASEKSRLTKERTAIESKYSEFVQASGEQLTRLRLS